ncbi:hypothetical protein ACTI_53980 [Actinoplanes sp. OR16]|uniref:hypothetical protein n=1 Tax=Actinoplanes sp. OR16 TaxID=946334 RepID=UPI000F6DC8C7|nr:hypothetical protein [Actinoplanes sp. OR16]BBH68713.1 hypothetical protein ACTI_53980 [Actinoplanes sp. OR16]
MTTVSDLRETLDAHAGDALLDPGMVAGARSRGLRLRRRRRLLGGTAAVALLVAGVLPFVPDRPPTPPVVVAPVPYRAVTELTATLVDGSDFEIMRQTSENGRETAMIRNRADVVSERPGEDGRNFGGELEIFDPGRYDPAPMLRGETVTVAGHEAYYLAASTSVGWEDPSGAWAVLTGGSRADVLEVAADVRIGEPAPARAPFRLGWVPGGLPITGLTVWSESGATVRWGDVLTLQAGSLPNPDWPAIKKGLPEEWATGAYRIWHADQPNGVFEGTDGSNSGVVAGDCLIYVTVTDRAVVPRAGLERLIRDMTVTSCEDPGTWQPLT